MQTRPHPGSHTARDEGFRRIRAVTGWIAAGSVAAIAAVAAVVGVSIPGHSSGSAGSTAARAGRAGSTPTVTAPAFSTPDSLPTATTDPPVVSSGAS